MFMRMIFKINTIMNSVLFTFDCVALSILSILSYNLISR